MTPLSMSSSAVQQLLSVIKEEWDQGVEPDACRALDQYPELIDDRSAVLDLACDELWRRQLAGEEVDAEAFAARFPVYATSVRNMLAVNLHLARNPQLLDQVPRIPWPSVGSTFADFELVRDLGQGAFARVYLAREFTIGNRPVAVKVSRLASHEAHTLGQLPHPGIVPILSARQDPATGLHFVCMPYLGSATLLDVLDEAYGGGNKPIPRQGALILQAIQRCAQPGDPDPYIELPGLDLDQVDYAEGIFRVGAQVAKALVYVHQKNIWHRDLKPSNILLTPRGAPLLLDFNLSAHSETTAQRIGGTLPYMPAEQIQAFLTPGQQAAPGEPVDMYALGVILYELLTGSHPFGPIPLGQEPEVLGPLLLSRQRGTILPVRSLNPAVDPRRAHLVDRCLSLDPTQRPRAAEMVEGLSSSLPSPLPSVAAPVTAGPACAPAPLPSGPSRLRAGSILLGALLIIGFLLAVAGMMNYWQRQPLSPEPSNLPLDLDLELIRLERGREERRQGRESAALELFAETSRNIRRATPSSSDWDSWPWQAQYLQGRALLLMGNTKEAWPHFYRALKIQTNQFALLRAATLVCSSGNQPLLTTESLIFPTPVHGRTHASLAYCRAVEGDHTQAVFHGERAATSGYRTPACLNNLAYSYIQLNRSKTRELAGPLLEEALHQDPNLQAAYLNRGRLAFLSYLTGKEELPVSALHDIERAIALVPQPGGNPPSESSELYILAAQLYAARILDLAARAPQNEHALEEHSACQAKALEYLDRASSLGANLETLLKSAFLPKALGAELNAARLQERAGPAPVNRLPIDLVDPVVQETF